MLKIYVIYNLFSKLEYHNTWIPQGHSKIVQIHMRHPVYPHHTSFRVCNQRLIKNYFKGFCHCALLYTRRTSSTLWPWILVWPMFLFFCKHLSLVVNKQDQRTMKTAIKIFLAFPSFYNWRSKTAQFWPSKSKESFLIFFSLKNMNKGDQLLFISYFDNFDF
jgi:hypothetical protein